MKRIVLLADRTASSWGQYTKPFIEHFIRMLPNYTRGLREEYWLLLYYFEGSKINLAYSIQVDNINGDILNTIFSIMGSPQYIGSSPLCALKCLLLEGTVSGSARLIVATDFRTTLDPGDDEDCARQAARTLRDKIQSGTIERVYLIIFPGDGMGTRTPFKTFISSIGGTAIINNNIINIFLPPDLSSKIIKIDVYNKWGVTSAAQIVLQDLFT